MEERVIEGEKIIEEQRVIRQPVIKKKEPCPLVEALKNSKSVCLFVDANNLFFSQKSQGWNVEPDKLYSIVSGTGVLHNALWYTATKGSEQERFINALVRIGYTVRKKAVKEFVNKDAQPGKQYAQKGNMDIELVTDMLLGIDQYDTVLLFSGDGDYSYALEGIRGRGKKVIVVSTDQTTAMELRSSADKFIDLSSLRPWIEKGTR